jgi:hypothetical protein
MMRKFDSVLELEDLQTIVPEKSLARAWSRRSLHLPPPLYPRPRGHSRVLPCIGASMSRTEVLDLDQVHAGPCGQTNEFSQTKYD